VSTSLGRRVPAAPAPRRPGSSPPPAVATDLRFGALARRLRARSDLVQASALGSLRSKAALGVDGEPSGAALDRVEELLGRVLAAQLRVFSEAAPAERLAASELIPAALLAEPGGFELLLFALRAGHLALWDAWFSLVEEQEGLAATERRALLSRGSSLLFSYAHLLGGRAVEIFRRETEALRLAPEQREARAFRALLAGDPLASASLSFDFARHHLGLIAWDADDPLALLAALARALARPLFTLRPAGRAGECWGWLSGTRALSPREEEVIAGWAPAGGRLAVGLEGFGEEGFRAGHRQAARARRLASSDSPLVRYDDVVVEALATENVADARTFLAHELRGIDDDSPASIRIRDTLLAWFRSGQNAASAASALGVHEQTVANRLRTAEERLGHVSIGARRIELELALRLHRRLGALSAESVDPAPPF
jgi:hypothetical protein